MGRPETPIDPTAGPLQRFAFELRELRASAGNPSYRRLASRANYSGTSLSEAARGINLPSLEVTLAFASACGGDTAHWERHWKETEAALSESSSSATGLKDDIVPDHELCRKRGTTPGRDPKLPLLSDVVSMKPVVTLFVVAGACIAVGFQIGKAYQGG